MGSTAIAPPCGDDDVAAARALVREYAESLDFSLCFQGFDEEMARFPADYTPPDGRCCWPGTRTGRSASLGSAGSPTGCRR